MTYFGFLALFLGVPLLFLALAAWLDRWGAKSLPESLSSFPFMPVLGFHVLVALLYTTPWDNYLVATGVWWYDRALVTGLTLGWVPLEEYTFFIMQTLFTGLWFLFLAHRLRLPRLALVENARLRLASVALLGITWLASLVILAVGWQSGRYLGLVLGWGLPPILLQIAFAGDVLWYYRRLVGLALLGPTLYLVVTDSLAISSGTWTINPTRSLPFLLGGVLPIEEAVFFLVTNTLIVFGLTLLQAQESQKRVVALWSGIKFYRRPAA